MSDADDTDSESHPQEIPNRHIRDAAEQHRKCTEFLFKNLQVHQCILPIYVGGAFALELFLKSLNARLVYEADPYIDDAFSVTSEPNMRDHSLPVLFAGIAPKFQEGLRSANKSATPIEALLKDFDVFIPARYPFEKQQREKFPTNRSINALVALLVAVGDYVSGLPVDRFLENPADSAPVLRGRPKSAVEHKGGTTAETKEAAIYSPAPKPSTRDRPTRELKSDKTVEMKPGTRGKKKGK